MSMLIHCCGSEHATQFCPDCGKLLNEAGTLTTLLAHCRVQVLRQQKRVQHRKQFFQDHPASKSHSSAKLEKTLAKWQGWVEALEDALENSE